MKTAQAILRPDSDVAAALQDLVALAPDLILAFASVAFFEAPQFAPGVRRLFPNAVIAGCSTAGEIARDRVYDHTCVLTAIRFAGTPVRAVATRIAGMADSGGAGARLAAALPADGLSAVLLLGTGVAINGSALVAGLQAGLPAGVSISGGLAADAGAFRQTWTWGPQGVADDQIVAVGLYGRRVRLGYGSFAGWEPFGPARKVTRCAGNILYELDGERALDVYQRYLGDYARDLPGSGLLFPFEMLGKDRDQAGIFRTILAVDEEQGALTLAGDIDASGYLKLMHSSTDKLINGAETAARAVLAGLGTEDAGADALALLVSCIGRKLVMGDRVDEEVEAVASTLARHTTISGFYSNGEIAGDAFHGPCRLHNQTMTITWIGET